ncbi:MAG: PhzF family phenazine biosynthesis protein [Deltaproteobacteria bacterium]|nr:PhzF family phenazine biosynthesis protein [Deltaproteobacteria bacterium]
MRRVPCYQVDAFTKRPFAGNPAAVCPLEAWLPDELMQQIAAENALSETAFLVPRGGDWDIRWMTPEVEVELCGHATLASALVVMTELDPGRARTEVVFHSRSGPLGVTRRNDLYTLDLPARPAARADAPPGLAEALGASGLEVARARDLVVVLPSSDAVRALAPDFGALARLPGLFAVCATAPGTGGDSDVDFVSRFFAPAEGIPEDPVTGSAHCTLTPFWASRLGKDRMRARQVSRRGGEIDCMLLGERVRLGGEAVLVKTGTLLLPR